MFFKKVKRLETENELLLKAIEGKEKLIEELRLRLNGERVCGGYCELCKHSYAIHAPFSITNSYGCTLDIKCKDFSRVDENEDE